MPIDAIEDRELAVTDSVCGKTLGLDAVAAHEDCHGWAYFFCSDACHRKFLANSGRYAVVTGGAASMDTSEHER